MRWWHHFRKFDDIDVFEVRLTENVAAEYIALEWLSDLEIDRRNKFLLPEPKRRFALTRAALRSTVCDFLKCTNADLRFDENEHGKPFAVVQNQPSSVSFNISHSGDFGLIAIGSSIRIGIDIEQRRQRRDLETLIDTVLAPHERSAIQSVPMDRKADLFFDFWTVKEAVLKAVGVGMSGPDPSEIEVPNAILKGATSAIAQYPQLSDATWRIEKLGNQNFAAAIAIELR